MESAKQAVKGFLSKSGKHDTDVHETVAPAVTHENIEKQQREEITTAVDKEVHQDHYHTTVQPVVDSERLPEQHHHRVIPTEHREFEHNNDQDVKRKLETEAARYRDETTRTEGATTRVEAPIAGGQHVHHHVHETIQPVVEKNTVDPHVVHTTVPIHEVHHNAAQHHNTSTLPTVSMNDFQRNGGSLAGREERSDRFDGEPKTVGTVLGNERSQHLTNNGGHQTASPASATGSNLNDTNTTKKASMMGKLNPRVDADGDGKTGIMD